MQTEGSKKKEDYTERERFTSTHPRLEHSKIDPVPSTVYLEVQLPDQMVTFPKWL